MNEKTALFAAIPLVTSAWLAACANSTTKSDGPRSATAAAVSMPVAAMPGTSPPPANRKPIWTVPTEEEVAAALDYNKELINAAKGTTKLKKDGVLMFCKRFRPMGSNIAQIQCITAAQLRVQFEDNRKYRDDMRQRGGKCDIAVGCSAN